MLRAGGMRHLRGHNQSGSHCRQRHFHQCRLHRLQLKVQCSSTSSNSTSSTSTSSRSDGWRFLFDLRERDTEWTEENKARLMAIVTAQQLNIPMTEMEERLDALMLLLPDLAGRLPRLHPELLAGLVRDLTVTSRKVLLLKDLLPAADVSHMVADRPQLLLQEEEQLVAAVRQLKRLLNVDRVDKLVEYQPLLLVTECVEEVLQEIRRLMPTADAQQLLAADPDWVLRVQRGQKWLGKHPDSDMGELISWSVPQQTGQQQQQQQQQQL